MNMAAVTGLMPVTGIPLPLVSYGGSSMIVHLALLGVILSVYRFGMERSSGAPRRPDAVTKKENAIAGPAEWRGDGRPHLSSI